MPRCPGFLLLGTMQLRLIPDWNHAWRWSSVRFLALGATVQTTLLAFPAQLQQYLPPEALKYGSLIALACMFLGAAGRVTTTEPPK